MPEPENGDARRSRDSVANTLRVAIGVSLLCSVLVSATAVMLKPRQEANRAEFRQRIVLEVAGRYEPGADVDALFSEIDVRLVDLESGEYVDTADAREFDPIAAANDPARSVAVPEALDAAGIGRRAKLAPVYLVREGSAVRQIILPVYGSGLWSTLRGYLALAPDGVTVEGLRFYEHAETPGLGDQIDKPGWLAQWPGKRLFDAAGNPRIEVIRGQVPPGDDAIYQADGLAGATLTGRGVSNLLQYWIGPHGFGPYLEKLRNEENADG